MAILYLLGSPRSIHGHWRHRGASADVLDHDRGDDRQPDLLERFEPHDFPSPMDSSAAAAAMNRVTSGVAIPSLRPLSTLSARRIRTGTAL